MQMDDIDSSRYEAARVPASASEVDARRRLERDDRARRNLSVLALDEPDPDAWLADILDALGLREAARKELGRCAGGCGRFLSTYRISRVPSGVRHDMCKTCSRAVLDRG
jgi:hypothetical protein